MSEKDFNMVTYTEEDEIFFEADNNFSFEEKVENYDESNEKNSSNENLQCNIERKKISEEDFKKAIELIQDYLNDIAEYDNTTYQLKKDVMKYLKKKKKIEIKEKGVLAFLIKKSD